MAITINGITCQEIVRDYEESADWDRGPAARKGFLCNWTDRFTVANGLLGLATTTTIGGTITLNLPASHPEIPSAYCRSIAIEPKGKPTQSSPQFAFEKAIVWADYGCIPWSFQGINYGNIDPNTPLIYAKQNLRTANETKTIPRQWTWFQSAGKSTGANYVFPVCVIEMEITLMHVPYLPAQAIITASQNPVNSKVFLGCPIGNVFFLGCSSDVAFDTSGTFDQNLTLTFKYRPIAPWTQDWNGSAWDTVLTGMSGPPFLGSSDLNTLLPSAYAG